jgi:TetR/AcrR family transcriptional repressor of nem operon
MTAPSMTEQGRATRERIVAAAAALIGEHGVSGTSLDDIRAATNSSKSQLYHYFGDDSMVAAVEQQGARGGCPIGTLAAALADTDERFRTALNDAFESWRAAIGGALDRLRQNHLLAADADLETLTTTTLAAIQGGLLLAKTSRDSAQLRAALEGAIAQLRAHGVPDKPRPRRH